MPIKPENRSRYPADWKAIRDAVLLDAELRCEHDGCTARQYAVGFWRLIEGVHVWDECIAPADSYSEARQAAAELWSEISEIVDEKREKPIVIVLTVADLDHQPEDCSRANLRCMCLRHHLAHDAEHHRANAQATRRAKAGTLELF